jgi:divalent metal cation (Fe/Co/Zn/Cd) transporter
MKLDVVLAVLVAIYIAVSSIRLARENVSLLMGTSAPSERREQLVAIARSVTGVEGVDQLLATFFGTSLHVHVDITVNRALSLIDAHEIGHRVEERLAAERDVARAVVHVGPSTEDRTVCER